MDRAVCGLGKPSLNVMTFRWTMGLGEGTVVRVWEEREKQGEKRDFPMGQLKQAICPVGAFSGHTFQGPAREEWDRPWPLPLGSQSPDPPSPVIHVFSLPKGTSPPELTGGQLEGGEAGQLRTQTGC